MRIYTIGCLLILLAFVSKAQPFSLPCGPDTIRYGQARASASFEYNLSTQSNILGYAMYYDAPQGITVSGFCFYGRAIGNTANTLPVTCSLYDFNPADTLPFGAALVQGTVQVDTSYHGGNMNAMKYTVLFSQPVTMYNGYIVALETDGSLPLKIYGNNSGDGGFEKLALAKYNGYWLNMIQFAADLDFYIEPIVDYELGAEITFADDSLCSPGTFFIGGAAPGVTYHRMYNQRAFNNTVLQGFTMEVLGATLPYTVDTFYTATTPGPVAVSFTNSIIGWTVNCSVTVVDTVWMLDTPVANFNTIGNGLLVDFFADSPYASNLSWDMGDGTTYGNQQIISHTFPSAGSYTVTMIADNECGTDTVSAVFVVPFTGINEQLAMAPQFTLYPNPATDDGFINYNGTTSIKSLEVFNMSGALVYGTTPTVRNGIIELPLQGVSPGLYFVRLIDENGLSASKKLVVAAN